MDMLVFSLYHILLLLLLYLLNSSNCYWIQSAKDLVSSLSPEMWESLFPAHLKETPLKNISSLPSAVCKLQNTLTKEFELLDFNNRISLAKTNSHEFAAFFNGPL
ncbi:hypothetical protein GEMRC1_008324 [Eukaryota sp. GEM-RC1]